MDGVSDPTNTRRIRFRRHAAMPAAGVVATLGMLTIATARWWLLPLILIPLSFTVWAVRSGTDATDDGITIRKLFGSLLLNWSGIKGISVQDRVIYAELADERSIPLPAVTPDGVSPLLEMAAQHQSPSEH